MSYMNLKEIEFYKRCSICKAVEVEGNTILSGEEYDEEFFRRLGIVFSDSMLSKECFSKIYPQEIYGDICDQIGRESCKEE